MPVSSFHGKQWIGTTIQHILSKTTVNNVLDIAAGAGTYYNIYSRDNKFLTHANWTAIEVWQPYIEDYKLTSLYETVILSDARLVNYGELPKMDIVFAGDVLEHMTKEEALTLAENVLNSHRCLIVSIPVVHWPQGDLEGNPYEIHVKDDWSDKEVREAFGGYILGGHVDIDIGVYLLSKDQEFIRTITT